MYPSAILTTLFDSISHSDRLIKVRAELSPDQRYIIVLPSTKTTTHIDTGELIKALESDSYVLAHLFKLEVTEKTLQLPLTLESFVPGWRMTLSHSHLQCEGSLPTRTKIKYKLEGFYNPGVASVSIDCVFLILVIDSLLVPIQPSKKFEFFRRRQNSISGTAAAIEEPIKTQSDDLNQLLGKQSNRKQASAILGPLIARFHVEKLSRKEIHDKFFQLVSEAHSELLLLGVDNIYAVHEYMEHLFGQRIIRRLIKTNSSALPLQRLQENLCNVDITDLDIVIDNRNAYEHAVHQAVQRLQDLGSATTCREMIRVFVDVLAILGNLDNNPVPADTLMGHMLVTLIQTRNYPWIDSALYYVLNFAPDNISLDTGQTGYTILMTESCLLHLQGDFEKLNAVSEAKGNLASRIHRDSENYEELFTVAYDVSPSVLLLRIDDRSLLFNAISWQRPDILRRLLAFHDVFTPIMVYQDRDSTGKTLLMLAVTCENEESISTILDVLVENLPDYKIRKYLAVTDNQGLSVAHLLLHSYHLISQIGHLLDWSQVNSNGQTPILTLACCYDHPEYDRMLTLALAKVAHSEPLYEQVDAKGNSVLHLLNPSTQILLDRLFAMPGWDLDLMNAKGQSPLMQAARYDRNFFTRALLNRGANIFQRDCSLLNALDVAKGESAWMIYESFAELKHQEYTAVRVTRSNSRIVYHIKPRGSRELVHKTNEELVYFCALLNSRYPFSWIPQWNVSIASAPDPWKGHRFSLQMMLYQFNYFLDICSSHPSFGSSDLFHDFFRGIDWSTSLPVPPSVGLKVTKPLSLNDIISIEAFYTYSIEQFRTLLLVYNQHSVVQYRLANLAEAKFKSLMHVIGQVAIKDMKFRPYLSLSPFDTFTTHNQSGNVLQVRTTMSLLEALEQPLKMIEEYKEASEELLILQDELTRLRESKSWILYLEKKRNEEVPRIEEKVSEVRTRTETLSQRIGQAHDTLAPEIAHYNTYQAQHTLEHLQRFVEYALRAEKDILNRLVSFRDHNFANHK